VIALREDARDGVLQVEPFAKDQGWHAKFTIEN
jgi:hypothetical protein